MGELERVPDRAAAEPVRPTGDPGARPAGTAGFRGTNLNHALLGGLQRSAGNRAVAGLVKGGPTVQREPENQREPEKESDWSNSTPVDSLPGEPVPGYEHHTGPYTQNDAYAFSAALKKRENDNKSNVAAFVGAYGSSMMELWGLQVSEAMMEEAEHAGWSTFEHVLKFVAIKGVEWILTGGLAPVAESVVEAVGLKVSEYVIEKAMEAGFSAYLEHDAERHEEDTKHAQLAEKKADLDTITRRFAEQLGQLSSGVIMSGLPSVAPYGEWLGNAKVWQLDKFRLPPLFPKVDPATVRATVAGLIVGELHGPMKMRSGGRRIGLQDPEPNPRDPTRVDRRDAAMILVRDMREAQIYAPSKELVEAIVGKVPIRQLPTVPLYIECDRYGNEAAAARLMAAYRAPGTASGREVDEFVAAYRANEGVVVTRNPAHDIEVTGLGLAGRLKLYAAGTGDAALVGLAGDVLRSLGEADGPDGQGTSDLATPAQLAGKTHEYLEGSRAGDRAWAQTMITNQIEKLVPRAPIDRWQEP